MKPPNLAPIPSRTDGSVKQMELHRIACVSQLPGCPSRPRRDVPLPESPPAAPGGTSRSPSLPRLLPAGRPVPRVSPGGTSRCPSRPRLLPAGRPVPRVSPGGTSRCPSRPRLLPAGRPVPRVSPGGTSRCPSRPRLLPAGRPVPRVSPGGTSRCPSRPRLLPAGRPVPRVSPGGTSRCPSRPRLLPAGRPVPRVSPGGTSRCPSRPRLLPAGRPVPRVSPGGTSGSQRPGADNRKRKGCGEAERGNSRQLHACPGMEAGDTAELGGPAPTLGGPGPTAGGPAPTLGGPGPTAGGPAPTPGAEPGSQPTGLCTSPGAGGREPCTSPGPCTDPEDAAASDGLEGTGPCAVPGGRGLCAVPGGRGLCAVPGGARPGASPAAVRAPQQPAAVKRKVSLSGCEACGTAEAKYRCPRCMTYSCSLLCVKKHKAESGCSGIRDKTAFQSLSDFTEMQLLSDYRFLEDTGRLADSAHRDTFVHQPTSSKALNFMKNRARRCNMNLKLLPIGFTRRRENSTFYHKREQMFYWHVKLVFPQSCAAYTERRVADKKTVEELLRKYIDPQESDPVIRQKLKVYARTPLDQVCIFLKVEDRKCNSLRYHKLDLSQTLAENLRQKTIIEYPTLFVVLKENSSEYKLLCDDNSDEDSRNGTDSSTENGREEGEVRDGS
ncbi:translation initiation factor IF-2 [Pristis pectinata]|uniref:translation initiation factor IF-2 n=1 Tax=Pristis pectinata TaxID=685728 RepID=UPI00223E6044|nr:translation initiation factor IF-2 [Pristis pectinata]